VEVAFGGFGVVEETQLDKIHKKRKSLLSTARRKWMPKGCMALKIFFIV